MDLLAYWEIQKTPQTGRWLLSTPATLRDLYDIMLTNRGKAPRPLYESGKKQTTLSSGDRRAWENTTGSSQSAINWWSKG